MTISYSSIECHSHFSILDGFDKVDVYAKRAAENNIPAIAITDHASLGSCVECVQASEKHGIKVVPGIEINISKPNNPEDGKKVRGYHHLLVYPMNEVGWKNLLKLNYISTLDDRYYYKPRIYEEDLFEHNEGLMVSSNCIGSILPDKLFTEVNGAARCNTQKEVYNFVNPDWRSDSKKLIEKYKHHFGDRFYIGFQCHGMPAQDVQREMFRELSVAHGVKLLPDCDAHFAHPDSAKYQEALLCVNTKQTLSQRDFLRSQGVDLLFGDNHLYYMYSPEEMAVFSKREELENTNEFLQRSDLTLKYIKPRIPIVHNDTDNRLRYLCESELKNRGLDSDDQYKDRLNEELSLLSEFSLSNYMLLVKDIKDMCDDNDILCNSRGSVYGSLTAHLLGLTTLSPIQYNLLWVRFLNRGRMSKEKATLPDIDLDVDSAKRHIIIDKIKNKYGTDNVANMATYGMMGARSAIKDSFRLLSNKHNKDKMYGISEAISKRLPNKTQGEEEVFINELVEESDYLKGMKKKYPEQFEYAHNLQGIMRNTGVHAAGIVIGNSPLVESMPIHYNKKTKTNVSNLDMKGVDFFGGVKVDILGLKTLGVHSEANKIYHEYITENKREILGFSKKLSTV